MIHSSILNLNCTVFEKSYINLQYSRDIFVITIKLQLTLANHIPFMEEYPFTWNNTNMCRIKLHIIRCELTVFLCVTTTFLLKYISLGKKLRNDQTDFYLKVVRLLQCIFWKCSWSIIRSYNWNVPSIILLHKVII